jgi:exodeoxyribonuclease V alpha subunit
LSHPEILSTTITVTEVFPGPIGGAIFFGKDTKGNIHHLIAGYATISDLPREGDIWTVKGAVERHPKYGQQIRVMTAFRARPSGRMIVDYLAKNQAFKGVGIGIKKAKRLWDEFSEELYSILSSGDVERLRLKLTEAAAIKLVEAWKKDAEEGEIIRLLIDFGFDVRLANKVRRVWREESVRKIQENPYRMLAFASWGKVDRMSRALGITRDDPRRQVAAVEAFLYRRLDAKHTLTPREVALKGVSYTLGTQNREEAQVAIDRAEREYAIVPYGEGYQPLGAAVMEKFIAERFSAMISGATTLQQNLFSTSLGTIVSETIDSFERTYGIKLNIEQRAGVGMAAANPLSVLTGGAGVGKTTVLKVIHEICERTGTIVKQMALSGRAAQRMREATGREASTIAKFLRECADDKHGALNTPLIIIDECSMLDLPTLYSIVRTQPPGARLLLVGDPYQLPPIGFGLVFNVLVSSPNVPRVELTQVHRQAQSSGIPQLAYDIRHGVVPHLPPFDEAAPGVFFVEARDSEIIDQLVYITDQLSGCDDVQILGVTKRGIGGVRNINATFHRLSNSKNSAPRKRLAGWDLAEGDPVIYLTNDYEKELWNGSLGTIERVCDKSSSSNGKKEARTLQCNFEGIEHEIPVTDLNNIDLAYAITVHKAQGSQFKRVVIPVVRGRLLDRALIYTGLTRGIEQIVFVGDRSAFNQAVKDQPKSYERMVGFTL